MNSREQAEETARKMARKKLDEIRRIARDQQSYNKNIQPFSMASYVTGFLECYDQFQKEVGVKNEIQTS